MPEIGKTPQVTADHPSAPVPYRHVAWNFAIIVLDVTSWMVGLAFVDAGTVLPVFATTLTASTIVIAALAVLPGAGWALLQLIGVSLVIHRPRKKPYVLFVAALGRSPTLLVPALLLLHPAPSKTAMLWVLVGCFGILFLTDGLIGAAWYDIIGKTIPARLRGRFFGSMSILSGLAALGAGYLVKRVLANPALPYPRQYGVLFAGLCAGLMLSFLFLTLIREPAGAVASGEAQPLRAVLRQAPRLWRGSSPLRRLLAVSWLGGLANLAWPFYVIYGMRALGLPAAAIAVFIWATALGNMLGSLFWAWVNDRHGPRWVVLGTASIRAAPPLLALTMPLLVAAVPALRPAAAAQYVYAAVFLLVGAVASGGMMGFSNYLLELAPAQERPLYVGLGNTLSAPGLLAPLLGGWLALLWSFPVVFVLAAIMGLASLMACLGLAHVAEKA